jgi:hypothetical protein
MWGQLLAAIVVSQDRHLFYNECLHPDRSERVRGKTLELRAAILSYSYSYNRKGIFDQSLRTWPQLHTVELTTKS